MTPCEPDRFEEKARELADKLFKVPALEGELIDIAAALRAVESEALERAAQVADSEMEDQHDNGNQFGEETSRRIRDRIRALKPDPAAAPAAEAGKAICKCPKGMCACDHHEPAPPQGAEARIAELERERDEARAKSFEARPDQVLRRQVEARKAAEAWIAELERLANDNAFAGMQHRARADAAEERVAKLEAQIASAGSAR